MTKKLRDNGSQDDRSGDSAKRRLRKRDDQIFRLRRVILDLVPPAVGQVLLGYSACVTRQDANEWVVIAAERTVELADRRSAAEMGGSLGSGDRAFCPLCLRGTSTAGRARGFSWPDGLRRHLAGEGNANQCWVLETFYDWATENATERGNF